jgi:hypothetical protein
MKLVAPIVVALGLVGAFMAIDRTTLHWYVPEPSSVAVPTVAPTADDSTRPPVHTAPEIVRAVKDVGWGADEDGCVSPPRWFPKGIPQNGGGFGPPRYWAVHCFTPTRPGFQPNAGLCLGVNDVTLEPDSSIANQC